MAKKKTTAKRKALPRRSVEPLILLKKCTKNLSASAVTSPVPRSKIRQGQEITVHEKQLIKKTCCVPKKREALLSSSNIRVGSKSLAKKAKSSKVSTLSTVQPLSTVQVPLRRSNRISLRLEKVETESGISSKSLETSRKTRSTKTPFNRKTPISTKTPKKDAKNEKLKRNIPAKTTPLPRSNRSYESASIDETFKCPAPVSNQNRGPIVKQRTSTAFSKVRPVVRERAIPICEDLTVVHMAKKSLSVAPKILPCRDKEFKDIFEIIENKILNSSSGCMYVSGVPGTGKTATITEAIRTLQLQAKRKKIPQFEFIEINGMHLTEPRQAYVKIYQQLTVATGTNVTCEEAHSWLDKRFTTPGKRRKTVVLLLDELDILCNRRQDVIYNLVDWTMQPSAQLFVATIGNMVDTGHSKRMGGIMSRLGGTRFTFLPYTQTQLKSIMLTRLIGVNIFESDAVELVARKVASISGDCRRALDICRRAIEVAESDCSGRKVMVSMMHVQRAFDEMICNPKVLCIKGCSKYERLFLQAVVSEIARTGLDETVLYQVYRQYESICAINGVRVPEPEIALRISYRLGASRLLICDHSNSSIHQRIMLNVTEEEMRYALIC